MNEENNQQNNVQTNFGAQINIQPNNGSMDFSQPVISPIITEPIQHSNLDNNLSQPLMKGQTPNMTDGKKKKSKLISLIIALVGLLLIGGGIGIYFINSNNTINIYRTIIKESVNEIFDLLNNDDRKINSTVALDVDLNLSDAFLSMLEVDKEIIEFINNTKVLYNAQIDLDAQKFVLKLDADYDKESLIDAQMFMDVKNKKTYLYAKEYLDKYLELPLEEEEYDSFSELFENDNQQFGKIVDSKKAKKILAEEFSKLIQPKDCFKENGEHVLRISATKIVERFQKIVNNLKNNKKFLNCFDDKGQETVKMLLDSIELDATNVSTQEIKLSIKKGMFSSDIKRLTIKSENNKVVFDVSKNEIKYAVNIEDEKLLDGYIKTNKKKETESTELYLSIQELGSIKLNTDVTYITGKDVESIDNSKVTKIEDLTEEELNTIMTKLEESKLYEIFGELPLEDNDDFDDYEDNDYSQYDNNEILLRNGKTLKITVPVGFEFKYGSNISKEYVNDDIELYFYIKNYYDSVDEVLDLDSYVKVLNANYKNVKLSEKNSKTVNGMIFYYKDLTYDYVSSYTDTTTKHYEKYICVELDKETYLSIEIESLDKEIPNSVVEEVLKISID